MSWFRSPRVSHDPPKSHPSQDESHGKNETYGSLLNLRFLARLDRLCIIARRQFGGQHHAERRSRRMGSSLEFADYRNYSAGDDLRNIDWNIYGRLDRLFLKLFEEEEDLPIHLLVDVSASMRWEPRGGSRPTKLDLARQIAGALTYIGLAGQDRVNVHYFSSTLGPNLGSGRGRAHFHRACEFLSRTPLATGATNLAQCMQTFGRQVKQRGLVILLSDFFDPGGYEHALGMLLYQGFEVQLVHLLDPADLNPRLQGDVRLTDPESEQVYEMTINESMARSYEREIGAFLTGLESFCRQRGIGYRRAMTVVSHEDFILRHLRAGGGGLVR